MEEKHIKSIMRTLKDFSDSIREITTNLESKVKGLLEYALDEFISQECLIRKEFKIQASK